MSRIIVRSIANIGKLVKNVGNVSFKSSSLTSSNVKCVPSMIQSFGRSYCFEAGSLEEYIQDDIIWRLCENKIGGFDIEKDGADVKFFRYFNDEKITIKFNINGPSKNLEINEEDEKSLFIQPPFTVEINKGKDKNLVLKLRFRGGSHRVSFPGIEILSFAIAKDGEVDNTTYFRSAKDMDKNVRSYLRKMLVERGLCEDFLWNFQEWATEYDYKFKREIMEDFNAQVRCI